MKQDEITLRIFNELAYDLAIRNKKVIELLHQPLTDESVKELLSFGIDATFRALGNRNHGLDELFLDYDHFSGLNHIPDTQELDLQSQEYASFRGYKFLIHPLSEKHFLCTKEDDVVALNRIKSLIETRGNRLTRLLDGKAFVSYDSVKFQNKTIYSLDPSTNSKKTIKADIEFLDEWTKPEKYLLLIPQYTFFF